MLTHCPNPGNRHFSPQTQQPPLPQWPPCLPLECPLLHSCPRTLFLNLESGHATSLLKTHQRHSTVPRRKSMLADITHYALHESALLILSQPQHLPQLPPHSMHQPPEHFSAPHRGSFCIFWSLCLDQQPLLLHQTSSSVSFKLQLLRCSFWLPRQNEEPICCVPISPIPPQQRWPHSVVFRYISTSPDLSTSRAGSGPNPSVQMLDKPI